MSKILYFNPEAALGGAERCLEELAQGIVDPPSELNPVALLLSNGPLAARLNEKGIKTEVFPLPPFWATLGESGLRGAGRNPFTLVRHLIELWRWTQDLTRVIEKIAPDIIHSNGIKTHLLTGLIGWRGPLVWHIHDFLDTRRISRFLLRHFSRRVSVAVTNSTATLERASDVLRCPLVRVYNGVPTPDPKSEKIPARKGKAVRIGLVATYARWKGHDLYFDAIAWLADQHRETGIEFYVCGGPIYRSQGSQWIQEDLEYETRRLNIDKLVRFRPFEPSLDKLYEGLDVVVNASINPEPFGRTVAEAMARKKAVILPEHGGVAELARDEKEAIHFAAGDAKELAEAMHRLANDEPLRHRLASAAKERSHEIFSLPECVGRWKTIYRSLAKSSVTPRTLITTGFAEDGWHSMRNTALGLFRAIEETRGLAWQPEFFGPSLGRAPRLWDRRLRYPQWIPNADALVLMDHSYADAILKVRHRFGKIIVVVNDFYFWRTRNSLNRRVRRNILEGIKRADVRIAISNAVRTEAQGLGIPIEEVILYGVETQNPPRRAEIERLHGCLVHVGGTGPRKGVESLFRLLERLPHTFFLVQVGAPFTPEQRRLIKDKRLTARVRVVEAPTNQEIGLWYRRAHAVLIPSSYEGFALPAVEARKTGARVFLSPETPAWESLQGDPGTHPLPFTRLDGSGSSIEKPFLERTVAAILNVPADAVPFTLASYFEWSRAAEEYCDVIDRVLGTPGQTMPRRKRA